MTLVNVFKKLLIGRSFATEKGRIKLFGYMDWTLVPSWVFAEILQKEGEDNGAEFLYEQGKAQAKKVGKDLIKFMGIGKGGSWTALKAVTEILEFIGFGKVQFFKRETESPDKYHWILHVTDNPVVEYANKKFGPKSLVCNWFMGVYAGHGEVEMGLKDVKLKETRCLCKGQHHCEWEAKRG